MRKALVTLIVAGIVAGVPAATGASPLFKGVVIARMPAHGELVVAQANGHATTLHASKLPAVGSVVRASASKLTVVGRAHHARFKGTLVRRTGRLQFFAIGHSMVVVHAAARSVASASRSTQLSPGEGADVRVTIGSGGALNEDEETPEGGENASAVTLQVTIAAVTPATATTAGSLTLTINGQTLVIPLPAGTVLPSTFVANATVQLSIKFKGACVGNQGDDDEDNACPAMTTSTSTSTTTTTTSSTSTTTTTTAATTTTAGCADNDGDRDDTGCMPTTSTTTSTTMCVGHEDGGCSSRSSSILGSLFSGGRHSGGSGNGGGDD